MCNNHIHQNEHKDTLAGEHYKYLEDLLLNTLLLRIVKNNGVNSGNFFFLDRDQYFIVQEADSIAILTLVCLMCDVECVFVPRFQNSRRNLH